MSLEVCAYFRDSNGDVKFLGEVEGSLAGFEAYRTDFYGSEIVRSLGLKILPQLASEDVYADREDLDALESEVRTLLTKLPDLIGRLTRETSAPIDPYKTRLENILRMIGQARAHPSGRGGVYIG